MGRNRYPTANFDSWASKTTSTDFTKPWFSSPGTYKKQNFISASVTQNKRQNVTA